MANILISASILSADFGNLGAAILQAEQAGSDWIHVDVMDGHFVPNLTMGPFVVETCRRLASLPLDVHLMIDNADNFIEPFISAGARRLTVHYENNQNLHRTVQHIRALGAHPGVAINPGTPVCVLESILPFVDMILIMTVNPGFSGQKFIPEMVEKIAALKHMIEQQKRSVLIQIDGGITPENIQQCNLAGAEVIVAATSIFKHPQGIAAGINSLRQAVK